MLISLWTRIGSVTRICCGTVRAADSRKLYPEDDHGE